MTSYNPFAFVMNAVSSPVAKKRKVDDISESATEVTLELIMGEVSEIKKSNERIESMLKILTGEAKVEEKEEEEEEDSEEDEEKVYTEDSLAEPWLEKFEELKKFHAKHGHCHIAAIHKKQALQRWAVRQRSEKKTGKMANPEAKIAKLNSLGFDWAPQATTPGKKNRR